MLWKKEKLFLPPPKYIKVTSIESILPTSSIRLTNAVAPRATGTVAREAERNFAAQAKADIEAPRGFAMACGHEERGVFFVGKRRRGPRQVLRGTAPNYRLM